MSETRTLPDVTRLGPLHRALDPDRWWVRLARLLLAGFLGWAVGTSIVNSARGLNDTNLWQSLSLFTIESNLLGAAVLAIGALVARRRLPGWWDDVRGAAAFGLVMTGLVYALVVAAPGELARWDLPWTNLATHRAAPVVLLLDWLLVTQTRRASWGRPLAWLVYPVGFVTFTWLRGPAVDWYPYAFLDPTRPGGWRAVLTTIAQVIVAFLACAVVLHVLGTLCSRLALGGMRASRRS